MGRKMEIDVDENQTIYMLKKQIYFDRLYPAHWDQTRLVSNGRVLHNEKTLKEELISQDTNEVLIITVHALIRDTKLDKYWSCCNDCCFFLTRRKSF